MGVLERRCHALAAVADRATEFLKGMPVRIRMGGVGLRRIFKSRIVNPEMTRFASVYPVEILDPPLLHSEFKINRLVVLAGFLYQKLFELFLIL